MRIKASYLLSIALIFLLNASTFSMNESDMIGGYELRKIEDRNVNKNASNNHSEVTSKTPLNSNITQEILNEVNRVRTNPQGYIEYLKNVKKNMNGNMLSIPGGVLQTTEGVSAIDDAIRDLERVSGLKPFQFSEGLSEVANFQLTDLKDNIKLMHTGKDGSDPFTRIKRVGFVEGDISGENIAVLLYPGDVKDIVRSLVVDDGVPDRGHRKNILAEKFNELGIAYGISKNGAKVCVMVFASKFTKSGNQPMDSVTKSNTSQGLCAKKSDGQQINLTIGNATGKAFMVNAIDDQCQETASKKEVPPGEIFQFTSYKDAVFRVREVGTNRLLGEIIVNPAKPEMLVQTDLDDSNSRIMYLEP